MSDLAGRSLEFNYTNWRGERAKRWATPLSFRWGVTEWHPEPGWLMKAFDHDKGVEREFALKDCEFTAIDRESLVGAAYEACAREMERYASAEEEVNNPHDAQLFYHAAKTCRKLTPTDARAALERIKEQVREEERARCAQIAETHFLDAGSGSIAERERISGRAIAAAIRALPPAPTQEDGQ